MSWSSGRGKPFIHPYTYFLVNDGLSDIFDSIKNGNRSETLKKLYWFTVFLDPHIQDDLTKDIQTMEDMMTDLKLLTPSRLRSILHKVMTKLHQEGYFVTAKFGPKTRERTMKDMQRKLEMAGLGTR